MMEKDAIGIAMDDEATQKKKVGKTELCETYDYYMENGYVVFTEHYHQQRGYCCRSGCRHCPYGFEKNKR